MKGRKRIALFCFLALLLAALPTLAACGDDEEETPKPAEEELVIGMSVALSGPAASSTGPSFKYYLAVTKYINEVLGGIEGFKIKLVWADNKYDPATSAVVFRELRHKHHPVMWLAWGDFDYLGVEDILERDKTPVLAVSASTPQLFDPPGMMFAFFGVDANMFTGMIRWVLQDWEASGRTGRPKVGTLHWDLPWGNAHKVGGTYPWAEEHGVDIVEWTYPPMALDVRPQLMALRDEGVDYIWFQSVISDTLLIIRDAKALGLWDEIKFIHGYGIEAYELLEIVGDGADGLYEVSEVEPYTSYTEAHALWDAILEFALGQAKPWDQAILAVQIEILEAVFRQAIEDVGRENINGEALYNAFQKLENINTLGLFHDLSWGPERRSANRFMKMKQYTKTGTVAVSDWIPMDDLFGKEAWGKPGWPSAD